MTFRILYISYDGMTDPLGQSQVMPYLEGLARRGFKITLISAEKKIRQLGTGKIIEKRAARAGIEWRPVSYTKRPAVLSTIFDIVMITRLAVKLQKREPFHIVHCRSYISAFTGLYLKRHYGVKFLFDMRGFWADERIEGGLWDLGNPLFRIIYRYFKKKETDFLRAADYAVILTDAGRDELMNWKDRIGRLPPVHVIPCCADLDHFSYENITDEMKKSALEELRLRDTDFIVTYLGSLGTWYMIDEMLRFFKLLSDVKPGSRFLVITQDDPEILIKRASMHGISPECMRIRPASRTEVPVLISLGRFSLFFIRPVYSKKASSPAKFAEILGTGVPVVCNTGVGDLDHVMNEVCPDCMARDFSDREMQRLAVHISDHPSFDPERLRAISKKFFSLKDGIEKYARIYSGLIRPAAERKSAAS